jgi:hypothetical protein
MGGRGVFWSVGAKRDAKGDFAHQLRGYITIQTASEVKALYLALFVCRPRWMSWPGGMTKLPQVRKEMMSSFRSPVP